MLLRVISEIEKKSKTKRWRIKIRCKDVFNGERKRKRKSLNYLNE